MYTLVAMGDTCYHNSYYSLIVSLIRVVVASNVPITSISCRTWISREARDPSLLLSCADNTLRLYRYILQIININ